MDLDLAELVHHWGGAYIISSPEPDVWLAERRDTRSTLRDTTPSGLLAKIRADYHISPVSRRHTSQP